MITSKYNTDVIPMVHSKVKSGSGASVSTYTAGDPFKCFLSPVKVKERPGQGNIMPVSAFLMFCSLAQVISQEDKIKLADGRILEIQGVDVFDAPGYSNTHQEIYLEYQGEKV